MRRGPRLPRLTKIIRMQTTQSMQPEQHQSGTLPIRLWLKLRADSIFPFTVPASADQVVGATDMALLYARYVVIATRVKVTIPRQTDDVTTVAGMESASYVSVASGAPDNDALGSNPGWKRFNTRAGDDMPGSKTYTFMHRCTAANQGSPLVQAQTVGNNPSVDDEVSIPQYIYFLQQRVDRANNVGLQNWLVTVDQWVRYSDPNIIVDT